MGRGRRISHSQLYELAKEGKSVTQIAEELGFTKGGISRAMKRMNVAVAKDVTLRDAGRIVDGQLDAMAQLNKINSAINTELDAISGTIRETQEAERAILQDAQIRHAAEIRKQIGLLLDIAKALFNSEEIAVFQKTVIEEIGRADPETKDRIVRRLAERRALVSTVGWDKPGV